MLKSKYDLLKHFADLEFKVGAEIGVSRGKLSEAMLVSIPDLYLYCVDPWIDYEDDRWTYSQEKKNGYFREAYKRLSQYNAKIIRKLSMDAVRGIIPESLDFVYIDSNHSFDYVMQDLIEWSKRVRKGGIVSGDDYYKFKGAGVIEAVDAYTKAHGIKFELTDPLTDKIQDRGSQEQPSFYWTKV